MFVFILYKMSQPKPKPYSHAKTVKEWKKMPPKDKYFTKDLYYDGQEVKVSKIPVLRPRCPNWKTATTEERSQHLKDLALYKDIKEKRAAFKEAGRRKPKKSKK